LEIDCHVLWNLIGRGQEKLNPTRASPARLAGAEQRAWPALLSPDQAQLVP